jgi:vitamin B12 transporter
MKKEKKNFLLKQTVSLAMVLYCAVTVAQQGDTLKTKELKPLVVSATRMEKNADSIGRSITVITSDELKNSVYNSLAEVISSKEGIYVVGAEQNPGMAQSIFMRGANSNQTVIMIDGVRLTDPSSTNNALDLSELSLANIDRIEIVRGAHSTMYGSSAIGGVINIITKKNQKTGFTGNAELKSGTFGKYSLSLFEDFFGSYSLKNGVYANFEFLGNNTNGLDATVDTVTDTTKYKNRDKDDFSKIEVNAKVGYKKNKVDGYVAFKNLSQVSDLDKSAYTDDDNYYLDFKRQLFSYGVSYKLGKRLNVSFDGGYTEMKRYAEDDSSIVDTMYVDSIGHTDIYDHTYYDNLYKGSSLTNELQFNYSSDKFDVLAGGSMFDETMTSENYLYMGSMWGVYEDSSNLDTLDINVLTSGAFIHADMKGSLLSSKLNKFFLAAGGRYTSHSMFGTNYTFEINPSWMAAKNTMLFVTYSTSFNAPSLYQLYAPFVTTVSGIVRGNENLKPETGKGFEGGLKIFPTENVTVGASYFYSKVENAIEYVYLWNKQTPVDSLTFMDYLGDTYLNIGTQYTQGIELSVTDEVSEKISFGGNISILSGKIEYSPASIDTAKTEGNLVQLYNNGEFINNKDVTVLGLTRRPNSANLFFSYNFLKDLSARMDVRYIGSHNDVYYNSELGPYGALGTVGLEDYALMDLSLKYCINNIIVIAKAENLFDKKYTEINGFTTKGRGLFLSLKYQL